MASLLGFAKSNGQLFTDAQSGDLVLRAQQGSAVRLGAGSTNSNSTMVVSQGAVALNSNVVLSAKSFTGQQVTASNAVLATLSTDSFAGQQVTASNAVLGTLSANSCTGQQVTASNGVLGTLTTNSFTGQQVTASNAVLGTLSANSFTGQQVTASNAVLGTLTGQLVTACNAVLGTFSANSISLSGDIVPTTSHLQSIGTSNNRFKDAWVDSLHIATNTLYLGDTPVLGTAANVIQVTADPDQSINVKTTGNGYTNLQSAAGVNLTTSGMNAQVVVQSTGAGGKVVFGATTEVDFTAPTSKFTGDVNVTGAITAGSMTVAGNLVVNGSNFVANADTVEIADNIMLLNKGQRDHKLDSYKLDHVAHHFTGQKKHDVAPADIFRLQRGTSADRSVIADYCVQDCALCNMLLMKLETLANNIGMANVCSVPLAWIFFRGQGVKSYSLISKAARADGYLIPTRSRVSGPLEEGGYEGAIVLDPQEGIHMEPVAVMDYSSLYPSCMCSENISHDMIELDPKYDNLPGVEYVDISYDTSDGVRTCRFAQSQQGIIPKILTHLIKQRKAARSKIPQAKDAFAAAVLEGLQLAYKLTSNSIYGQMGAVTSPVFMKDIAACTTATGRRMLLKAKAYMEDNYGANVIYGDTDSIFCIFVNKDPSTGEKLTGKAALQASIHTAVEATTAFAKELKQPHSLQYEKHLWPLILLSKKRYTGNLYEHDVNTYKQKSMGIVLQRRDNCLLLKNVYGSMIDIILNKHDVVAAAQFLQQKLRQLVDGRYPLEDLVITKSLKSEYKDPTRIAHRVLAGRMAERDPGSKPQVNERLPYVYIQVPDVKGKKVLQGDRIEHPDYIRAHAKTVKPDYAYYVTNQILQPVSQLMALALESVQGYGRPPGCWQALECSFLKQFGGDHKAAHAKVLATKEREAKALLFDPILMELANKKNKCRPITDFFKAG
eukprot:jgi/Chrzof1/9262/UNPLg00229.t1